MTRKAEMIEAPTELRDKAGRHLSFDEATLKRAEAAMAEVVKAHADWPKTHVARMRDVLDMAGEAESLPKPVAKKLHGLSHDLRGTGASFDFELLSEIGDLLCRYLETRKPDRRMTSIAKLHVDLMTVVVTRTMTGAGGDLGKSLVDELRQAVAAEG